MRALPIVFLLSIGAGHTAAEIQLNISDQSKSVIENGCQPKEAALRYRVLEVQTAKDTEAAYEFEIFRNACPEAGQHAQKISNKELQSVLKSERVVFHFPELDTYEFSLHRKLEKYLEDFLALNNAKLNEKQIQATQGVLNALGTLKLPPGEDEGACKTPYLGDPDGAIAVLKEAFDVSEDATKVVRRAGILITARKQVCKEL